MEDRGIGGDELQLGPPTYGVRVGEASESGGKG